MLHVKELITNLVFVMRKVSNGFRDKIIALGNSGIPTSRGMVTGCEWLYVSALDVSRHLARMLRATMQVKDIRDTVGLAPRIADKQQT